MDRNETTKTVFRKFSSGEVIAMFPEIPFDDDKRVCMSYMHIGQHGACSYGLIYTTKPATENEYADLLKELQAIGYNVSVRKRITKRWY